MSVTMESTIAEFMWEAHQTAIKSGWWNGAEPRNFGEQIALMHSELSEVLEEYRDTGLDCADLVLMSQCDGKPLGIAIEFADVLIRIFDTCERYGIPLAYALVTKMEFNERREYRHGGKVA